MDGSRFDRLVRELLGGASRRSLLRSVSTLPVVGALASLVVIDDDAAEAKKKKNKKNCKKKKKKACRNKCGTVTFKCNKKKKRVNCGACTCDPNCPVCQICDETTDTCIPDPEQVGDPCGEPGEVCQADGTCAGPTCDVCDDGCEFDSIQQAIDTMPAGSTITVCAGTYAENLTIGDDVTIVGAGDGDNPANDTILDGSGDDASVVRVEADGVLATLQFLRITGGGGGVGAGVDNAADVTLTNCTVTGNAATSSGGGLFNVLGRTMTLINCTVANNISGDVGGGISNQGTLILTNTDVTGNQAFGGGGIFTSDNSTATLDADSSVTGNHAGFDGGGVFNRGEITCTAAIVTDNTAGDPPVANDCINAGSGAGCATCAS